MTNFWYFSIPFRRSRAEKSIPTEVGTPICSLMPLHRSPTVILRFNDHSTTIPAAWRVRRGKLTSLFGIPASEYLIQGIPKFWVSYDADFFPHLLWKLIQTPNNQWAQLFKRLVSKPPKLTLRCGSLMSFPRTKLLYPLEMQALNVSMRKHL